MTTDTVLPPELEISRQVGHILWISVIVSTFAFAFSMVTFGTLSLWIIPAAYAFSLAHNITLLVLSAKERNRPPEARNGMLPATSKKGSIVCAWLLMLSWLAGAIMLAIFTIVVSQEKYERPYFYIVPWVEFSFAILEVGVMGFLAVQCVRERRRIIGLGSTAKWYQLGSFNPEGDRS
ncbi:hypothetical protein M413DRAFT_443909 [Hebeloma cylindrosporum]|uniref:Uncharacterized protein n=1 Tax=Hebeloma cylindrosporum TaxID=76867 RepID=A0A0C3CG26_HEBCY|nr:hypothetical protein M413DRAFT_443909 [Hebeloma cylindrosporum h7]